MTQTAIHLPDDLVAELYRRAPQPDERTALVAEALRYFFDTYDAANNELEILNRYADELNQEAEDVLDYQAIR
jgi:metal-responsive CopG/Arc/MetJ family transcriptional regulator